MPRRPHGTGGLFAPADRPVADTLAALASCNPFRPERIRLEREVLGDAYVDRGDVWFVRPGEATRNPNVLALEARAQALADGARARLVEDGPTPEADLERYAAIVLYLLYNRYEVAFYERIVAPRAGPAARSESFAFFDDFARDAAHYLGVPGLPAPRSRELAHLFATFFQVRRAFHFIFRHVIGRSHAAAAVRAAAWESIFTHDLQRFRRVLFNRMRDVTTLVVGESGTGKELVARAIGLAGYIPFDPATRTFAIDFRDAFHAVNLAALAPTLVESELFGHAKGAFTGAVHERPGWLEVCGPYGTLLLDEVGELEPVLQVKLLRVLQARSFQRLGETRSRAFEGRLVAATNRDLAAEVAAGRCREDFFYRLRSDVVRTVPLREQLAEWPDDLVHLLLFIAERIVGAEEAEALAAETAAWVETRLGPAYPWPGNVRELEQCVRNILVRREYHPIAVRRVGRDEDPLAGFWTGTLRAEELLRRYCTVVYAATGSYVETARRLGIDRRTVRARIDPALLATLQRGGEGGGDSAPRGG